jgi:hypothetical protein
MIVLALVVMVILKEDGPGAVRADAGLLRIACGWESWKLREVPVDCALCPTLDWLEKEEKEYYKVKDVLK